VTTMEAIGFGIFLVMTIGFGIWVLWLAFRD
jgi:hypothetical protein